MLPALFKPRSVAVVGASHSPNKVGTQILSNIQKGGYKGKIYPINPKGGYINDLPVYPNLSQAPSVPELAVIAVKPQVAVETIKEAVELGVGALVVISAGFKETSATGAKLEEKIKKTIKAGQTRLLGVNCLGLLSYADGNSPLNATFLNKLPAEGSVAFASQSGAFGSAVVDWADKINLGFKYFVSLGNKTDLNEIDFLKTWAEDDQVKVIALYLENIADGRAFFDIVKKITPKKPVIILMPGSSKEAKKAITSHTGSLVNDEAVLELVFNKANVIRAKNMRQFFKLILLANVLTLTQTQVKPGRQSVILTNAGGPGVLATDLINQHGLSLAQLKTKTKTKLKSFLPKASSVKNPVDVLGDAPADRYRQALEVLTQADEVDQIFIILTPQTTTEVKETARVIAQMAEESHKLLVPIFIGGSDVKVGLDYLRQAGVPAYSYIVDAVEAVAKVSRYRQAPTTQAHPVAFAPNIREFFNQVDQSLVKLNYAGRVDPKLSQQLLKLLGLDLPPGLFFKVNETPTAKTLSKLNYPLVAKLASTQVLHNTDVKGVYTNIKQPAQLTQAVNNLKKLIYRQKLDPVGTYIQIQEQVENQVELLVGLKKDPDFGHTMILGGGGIYANLYQDIARLLLPTDPPEIRSKLKTTKVFKLLRGYRGQAEVDIDKVVNTIWRLSLLPQLLPHLKEADFNPIIANRSGLYLADVKLIW